MTEKKRVNSRRKGKTGELELARRLGELGFPAKRGQQFKGGQDSPDVVCEGLGHVHFEVKRTADCKMFSPAMIREWEAQARRDAGDKLPAVAHRWNRSSTWWIRVHPPKRAPFWQPLEDFINDIREGVYAV